jgi:hypothetical protein
LGVGCRDGDRLRDGADLAVVLVGDGGVGDSRGGGVVDAPETVTATDRRIELHVGYVRVSQPLIRKLLRLPDEVMVVKAEAYVDGSLKLYLAGPGIPATMIKANRLSEAAITSDGSFVPELVLEYKDELFTNPKEARVDAVPVLTAIRLARGG